MPDVGAVYVAHVRVSCGQTHVRGIRRGFTGQGETRVLVKGAAAVKRMGGDAIEGVGGVE